MNRGTYYSIKSSIQIEIRVNRVAFGLPECRNVLLEERVTRRVFELLDIFYSSYMSYSNSLVTQYKLKLSSSFNSSPSFDWTINRVSRFYCTRNQVSRVDFNKKIWVLSNTYLIELPLSIWRLPRMWGVPRMVSLTLPIRLMPSLPLSCPPLLLLDLLKTREDFNFVSLDNRVTRIYTVLLEFRPCYSNLGHLIPPINLEYLSCWYCILYLNNEPN